nr:hypothetical protein [Verminephrobacter aporrectodeae]
MTGQLERRRHGAPLLDPQAGFVNGDRDHVRAREHEAVARADMPGVFKPDPVARVDQHFRDQLERVLRAADDEDLPGVAGDPAVHAQMGGNGLAQAQLAMRLGVAEHRLARVAPMLARQPEPLRHRKRVEGRHPGRERLVLVHQAGAELPGQRNRLRQFRARDGPDVQRRVGGRDARVQGRADMGAGADPGFEQALGDQPLKGLDDGRARDPEFARHGARRRQAVPRRQRSVEQQVFELAINLGGQGLRGAAVQNDGLQQHAA